MPYSSHFTRFCNLTQSSCRAKKKSESKDKKISKEVQAKKLR